MWPTTQKSSKDESGNKELEPRKTKDQKEFWLEYEQLHGRN